MFQQKCYPSHLRGRRVDIPIGRLIGRTEYKRRDSIKWFLWAQGSRVVECVELWWFWGPRPASGRILFGNSLLFGRFSPLKWWMVDWIAKRNIHATRFRAMVHIIVVMFSLLFRRNFFFNRVCFVSNKIAEFSKVRLSLWTAESLI